MTPTISSSQTPVPSISLLITPRDADRFLDASEALNAKYKSLLVRDRSEAAINGDNDRNSDNVITKPLHEMLLDAANLCDHPMIVEFLGRMKVLLCNQTNNASTSTTEKELEAAILLFHDCDKTAKLRHLFSILSFGTSNDAFGSPLEEEKKDDGQKIQHSVSVSTVLNQNSAVALFRIVLMAISCCIRSPDDASEVKKTPTRDAAVERCPFSTEVGDVDVDDPPVKMPKIEQIDVINVREHQDITEPAFADTCQSPSWDSSTATLRDEDDKMSPVVEGLKGNNLRHEIEEIAKFACAELMSFVLANRQQKASENEPSSTLNDEQQMSSYVDFATFGEWYNTSGSEIVPWLELLQHSKWKPQRHKKEHSTNASTKKVAGRSILSDLKQNHSNNGKSSLSPKTYDLDSPSRLKLSGRTNARTLVSFNFNGSASSMLITISEDNLHALQALINRTGLVTTATADVLKAMNQVGTRLERESNDEVVLEKENFKKFIRRIISKHVYSQLSSAERDFFDESFADFFSCFEGSKTWLPMGQVDLKEFAVGFCFFCAGSKSAKLLAGFELLDVQQRGLLTEDQLIRYLTSYLTMLVAVSLLTPISKRKHRRALTPMHRKEIRSAVESGANWTLAHFLQASGKCADGYSFECFANWYSSGGYNVAPWLELLDLKKLMALISEPACHLQLPPLHNAGTEHRPVAPNRRDRVSSMRRHHSNRRGPQPEVLFTFPLGNRRSLVVLKEDATYVRSVVEQLGLLAMKPDALWSALLKSVQKRRKPAPRDVAVYVDMSTFVDCMKEICPKPSRKRTSTGTALGRFSSFDEILANFYQCFDIDQCDSVALDELMGGLTLLCGGKKSTKLSFAFSIFDTRPGINSSGKRERVVHSLSGEDLFLFLRSILIVTFSTCRQSLDMTDEIVGRSIADTANMICNDVMRHQWETKQSDRLDFDEFGQWYNDGGFERAPWLELLDLNKWVLLEEAKVIDKEIPVHSLRPKHNESHFSPPGPLPGPTNSPPPHEEVLDNTFLDEIDSMDEMDMMIMETTSADPDELKISKSFSYSSPSQLATPSSTVHPLDNPLKFHLVTTDEHGGYMLSVSPVRISHFRRILEASGLHALEAEVACNLILNKCTKSKLSRKAFDSAMKGLLSASLDGNILDEQTEQSLEGVFNSIFEAFDHEMVGSVNAIEVACGFTVLCRGKKSDKLEFAFEVLDKKKRGRLSRTDMSNYLQSFLTVLLTVAFSPSLENDSSLDILSTMTGAVCERSTTMLVRSVRAGASWAASLAFRDFESGRNEERKTMSFDDFASWYTRVGYSSIPWLELLDLQKWAMVSDVKK